MRPIVARAPYRLSFNGGGSDYPCWTAHNDGMVVGASLAYYCHLVLKELPPFHPYKSRFVYSKIEEVEENKDVEHRAIRACLAQSGDLDSALELFHMGDLPGRCGVGSSSSFVVCLLMALAARQGKKFCSEDLAELACKIEQEDLGETVGCQDQYFAACGGINVIRFRKGRTLVEALPLTRAHEDELKENLLLLYTGKQRTSSEVASTYKDKLLDTTNQYALVRLADLTAEAIMRKDWERMGSLVDQGWRIKMSLSPAVADTAIQTAYATARVMGAHGGKLTGAGGGGCLVLLCPPEKKRAIKAKLGMVEIPVGFDHWGATC